jgi:hypothetical protein
MNLRISNGQLRFRITREELNELLQGRGLELVLPLTLHTYHYLIQCGDVENPLALQEESGQLTLLVDKQTLAAFEKQLPSRDGIEQEVVVGGAALTLILEVDVKKSPKH